MTVALASPNPKLEFNGALVSCEWLQENLDGCHRIVVLDATYFLPRQQRNAQQEFQSRHIFGAQFFDIDEISDSSSPLPHTLPKAKQFACQVGQLGIDNDTWVIVYDDNHFFASARVWWMFRVLGHDKVKVLDGGLKRWRQLSLPLTEKRQKPMGKAFHAVFHPELFVDLAKMQTLLRREDTLILDARSEDSFNGTRPMHEPGLMPGHIPGSVNVPYRNLFMPDDHRLRPVEQLQQLLSSVSLDGAGPIVTTCGSGVSAALLLLALYQIGVHQVAMYDGSWAEWGRQTDLPIEQTDKNSNFSH